MKEREDELLEELLIHVQRRYTKANEILRLTQEIAQSLHRNDRVSTQLLIQMRQEEMDGIDKINEILYQLLHCCGIDQQARLSACLWGRAGVPEGTGEKRIFDISGATRKLFAQAINIDKTFSQRLAGNSSFYSSEKGKRSI